MRRGAGRSSTVAAAVAATFALAACGGGARQDAKEKRGTYFVSIAGASFPTKQKLSQHSKLVIAVTNSGRRTIPDLTVTICNVTCQYPARVGEGTSVKPFATYLAMAGVASHSRQVWVIDRPPGTCAYSCQSGGVGSDSSSDANTWAGGSLKPGHTKVFSWGVTAVQPGRYTVAWRVSAGQYGNAKAVLPDGSRPEGKFAVSISRAPAQSYVNDTGSIVVSK